MAENMKTEFADLYTRLRKHSSTENVHHHHLVSDESNHLLSNNIRGAMFGNCQFIRQSPKIMHSVEHKVVKNQYFRKDGQIILYFQHTVNNFGIIYMPFSHLKYF